MNRLWLSIRGLFRKNRENKKEPFCFRGYSSEFSVSDYLRRMLELSACLVKERIEVPKPNLTFNPFASDLSIETPQNTRVTPESTVGLLPEANMTGRMREEWIQREITRSLCVQAQPLENEKYQVECSSAILRLQEELSEQRYAASQSVQNQILQGLMQQNQAICDGMERLNSGIIPLPVIAGMLGVQASDCFRNPCATPYSNIPRGFFD